MEDNLRVRGVVCHNSHVIRPTSVLCRDYLTHDTQRFHSIRYDEMILYTLVGFS